ncbi:MAG: sugar MFS transporter [Hyphomonadaceae bacterium]|nr:sugar MFS transporter [Hyphomonadaceae bacterium]
MAQAPTPAAQSSGALAQAPGWMAPLVVALFFLWGFATVLIDHLTPKFKAVFELNFAEANLTQFCFFGAYFLVSMPAAVMMSRIGYMNQAMIGLAVMAAGCLGFVPATATGEYWPFLVSLFVLGAGVTMLQVAANPLIAILGKPSGSHARLMSAQFFNSLATFVGPLIGAVTILHGISDPPDISGMSATEIAQVRATQAHAVQGPFVIVGLILLVLALVFLLTRKQVKATPEPAPGLGLGLLGRPRVLLAVLGIFTYVGAEVTIGNNMANYIAALDLAAQPLGPLTSFFASTGLVAGLSDFAGGNPPLALAGALVALYWGGAMLGRLVGAVLLTRVKAGPLLMLFALAASALAVISINSTGQMAFVTIICIGLFNSIMFPTIFTLGIEGLGARTPEGSGLLCMAIVGGAVAPLLTGYLADQFGLNTALYLPALCYLYIAFFGFYARKDVAEPQKRRLR